MHVSCGVIPTLKLRSVLGLLRDSVPLGIHIYVIRAELLTKDLLILPGTAL